MTREEISERIITLMDLQLGPDEEIKETDTFQNLGMDSLDSVESVMNVEKEFDIMIPDPEAEVIRTVGQLVDQVHRQLNSNQTPTTNGGN